VRVYKVEKKNSEILEIPEFFTFNLCKGGFAADRLAILEGLRFHPPTPQSFWMNDQREAAILLHNFGLPMDLDATRLPGLLGCRSSITSETEALPALTFLYLKVLEMS